MKRAFPLAVITDEVSQDIDKVIQFARDFKLDGVEVRSLFGKPFKDLTSQDVKEIKKVFSDEGLKIIGCASPVFKCHIDQPAEIQEHLDIFKRSVDMAMEWNCDMVRVFTFLRKNTPTPSSEIQQSASYFPKLIECIKGTPVRIGVENEYSAMVGSGAESQEFLNQVNHPCVGLVWDPCNVVFLPHTGNPVTEDFPMISDRIIHFHVKDSKKENGKPPTACVEVGKGEINFPLQLTELKKMGYKGWVSLETHWRDKSLSSETQYIPAGHAFSAEAEPASRICMAKLSQMIENLD